ncbi:MAG: chemotaxis response regulator protein-glutamate methylesterase [Amphritea sp.]|nr:chemotaxis response regulator protein-glutamate methylesterase [Amphritea sp.]
MSVRVLIVDDSLFFRNRIKQILSSEDQIEVVGAAKNGAEAVILAQQLRPDVITLDVEMPEMDGITALKQIMQKAPAQVLMLSSLTKRSAAITLEALDLGAADYMEKDASQWVADSSAVGSALIARVVALGNKSVKPAVSRRPQIASRPQVGGLEPRELPRKAERTAERPRSAAPASVPASEKVSFPACRILTIGSSTGGPAALQEIMPSLSANLPFPVLITQHMPKTFTAVFAKRLNELCKIEVKEAEDGDRLLPGHAYLAPGGQQMIIDPAHPDRLIIRDSDERMTYKPSVDLTFASVAKAYGAKTLGIVLTGMGADGCEGARLLKNAGSVVWAQDQDSCIIFGMPKAVITAGLADEVLDLKGLSNVFRQRGN